MATGANNVILMAIFQSCFIQQLLDCLKFKVRYSLTQICILWDRKSKMVTTTEQSLNVGTYRKIKNLFLGIYNPIEPKLFINDRWTVSCPPTLTKLAEILVCGTWIKVWYKKLNLIECNLHKFLLGGPFQSLHFSCLSQI